MDTPIPTEQSTGGYVGSYDHATNTTAVYDAGRELFRLPGHITLGEMMLALTAYYFGWEQGLDDARFMYRLEWEARQQEARR